MKSLYHITFQCTFYCVPTSFVSKTVAQITSCSHRCIPNSLRRFISSLTTCSCDSSSGFFFSFTVFPFCVSGSGERYDNRLYLSPDVAHLRRFRMCSCRQVFDGRRCIPTCLLGDRLFLYLLLVIQEQSYPEHSRTLLQAVTLGALEVIAWL